MGEFCMHRGGMSVKTAPTWNGCLSSKVNSRRSTPRKYSRSLCNTHVKSATSTQSWDTLGLGGQHDLSRQVQCCTWPRLCSAAD